MKVDIYTQFNDGRCIHCGERALVKAGKRKSIKGTSRQLYRCNVCCRRFSSSEKHGKHTPGKAILRALVLVCRGCSYPEVQLALKREFGIVRAVSTISRWCKEHALPYLDISKSLASTQGPLVRSFLFTHNGLNYNYQLHTGKLTFAARYPGLIQYLYPAKVVSQLSLYAEALHRRAQVPQQDIRCAYFDERDIYYFDPVDIAQAAQTEKTTFQTYPARRSGRSPTLQEGSALEGPAPSGPIARQQGLGKYNAN